MWQIATPWVAKLEFEDNLSEFLAKLPMKPRVWTQLCKMYDCRLTVVLRMRTWNRGGEISVDAMRALAARGLKLELDIYFDDDSTLWADKHKAGKRVS